MGNQLLGFAALGFSRISAALEVSFQFEVTGASCLKVVVIGYQVIGSMCFVGARWSMPTCALKCQPFADLNPQDDQNQPVHQPVHTNS